MDVKDKIKSIIENIIEKKIEGKIEKLSLSEDLMLSSLEILLLVTDIEKEFNITLEQEAIYNIFSVGDLVELVNKLSQ